MTDEELSELALAANPEPDVEDDAPSLDEVLGSSSDRLLPDWYMPAPMAGGSPVRGWRRVAALTVIASFLVITAAGLCNTYGQLPFS